MKEKGFKIVFVVYIVMFLVDLISTICVGDLVQYLEANPLFKYGGLPLICVVNIIIMYVIWRWYTRSNKADTRYIMIYMMVAIIITRIIVVISNFQICMNPPTLEQAMSITDADKLAVLKQIYMLNILPYLNAIITFIFFKKDHTILIKK